ncbi:branched-chain amino acid transporter permease subunit LivH [Citrobacter koseri]|uniref:Branched-chain amino acid transporter permease subunit LivH n=1 Tax=Citrobacter koseri TaxID=545 RepID=A0A3S4M5T1_CITKO|nr:branched-chain amino acid transporter permease subunit LivH [Citrobacter koseri]
MSEQFLYFLQQMFNGVTLGSTYALIAIGYTMVYGIIGMINFAHGEVYMIGSYVSFMIIAALMMMGIDTSWLLVAAGFVGAIIIASAYGWSIERVAYRPVRSSKRLIALISAIGMSIFLQNYVSLTEGSRDVALPSLFNGQWIIGSSENFAASINHHAVGHLDCHFPGDAGADAVHPLLPYGTRLPRLCGRPENGESAGH